MNKFEKRTPEAREALLALAAVREQSSQAPDAPLKIRVGDSGDADPIAIPRDVVEILIDALDGIASGHGGTNKPKEAELSVTQAAEVLYKDVSHVIELIEKNEIPHRMVGNHPRLRVQDVMDYRSVSHIRRRAVLDQLVADAQEQNMGY